MAPKDISLRRSLGLTVGALGVVFGDIGTSPLYAMRETALAVGGHAASQAAVYGACSLIFWALVIVVTVKYVIFIMRADNNGEGGVMALAALAHRSPVPRAVKTAIGVAALMGLALFYGSRRPSRCFRQWRAWALPMPSGPGSCPSRSSFWCRCFCSRAGAPTRSANCSGR
jgi:hypothetical protein